MSNYQASKWFRWPSIVLSCGLAFAAADPMSANEIATDEIATDESANNENAANEITQQAETAETQPSEAVVSDRSAEKMAREILMLQEQLGGSVVGEAPRWQYGGGTQNNGLRNQSLATDQNDNRDWTPYPPFGQIARLEEHNKVSELREAAYSLETTAHRLEKLDLYEQADALRNVASRLRRDSRELKRQVDASSKSRTRIAVPPPITTSPIRN